MDIEYFLEARTHKEDGQAEESDDTDDDAHHLNSCLCLEGHVFSLERARDDGIGIHRNSNSVVEDDGRKPDCNR